MGDLSGIIFKVQDDVGERKNNYNLLISEAVLGSKRRFLFIRTVSSEIMFQESNGFKTLVSLR